MFRLFILFSTFLLYSFSNRTYQEVLLSNFKDCNPQKETVFLTDSQKQEILKLSKVDDISKLIIRYRLNCNGETSFVYVNSHIVRTMNETLLIEVNKNQVKALEVANFNEPMEYFPSDDWRKQILGKVLSDRLNLKADVDALSGSTLTANAVLNTARNFLAVDQVLQPKELVSEKK